LRNTVLSTTRPLVAYMSGFDLSAGGKTYLITGGAGFIGSHVVEALLTRGAQVLVVDDFNDFYNPKIKEANIACFVDHPRFRLYRADLRRMDEMREVFTRHGKDLQRGGILHLAARAGVRPSLGDPRLYLETNVTGTLNVADLAKEFSVKKFVFASSSSVYGDSADKVPFREDQDVSRPVSPYAATKAMGESLLHSYSHLYGLGVVALRFFTVYGPRQRPDLAIHKFTRLIDEGLPVPMFGDGSTRRDYTYIDDIVQGVLAALLYDATPFEVFNLGESQTTSLAALIALLEVLLGKTAKIDHQSLQPGDVPLTFADISKARELLGYAPKTPLAAGLPLFVDWYRSWLKSAAHVAAVRM
jgi:UDP-glucuronate 4-epimerase